MDIMDMRVSTYKYLQIIMDKVMQNCKVQIQMENGHAGEYVADRGSTIKWFIKYLCGRKIRTGEIYYILLVRKDGNLEEHIPIPSAELEEICSKKDWGSLISNADIITPYLP